MNLMPKNAVTYYCEKCDFKCSKQSNWNNHVNTRKHINRTLLNDLEQKNAKKCRDDYECECGKIYSARNSLWYHKKKCSIIQKEETVNNNNISTTDIDKEFLIKMLLKNQDIMEGILFKNSDVMNKMLEVMPQIGNTTNTNSHNTINNQFNINMFLNEHCKNAMNLTDFIESLPITNKTYDETIENGLTKTITNMMVNGLKKLDVLDRPIHCTDIKRKTLYVKESDIWEKDKEWNTLLEAIQQIASKQRMLISKWQEANKGWEIEENIQTKLTTLVYNVMTDIENNEKETKRIITAIGNKVYLDEEIKNKYL
jgi:hypothetical protein